MRAPTSSLFAMAALFLLGICNAAAAAVATAAAPPQQPPNESRPQRLLRGPSKTNATPSSVSKPRTEEALVIRHGRRRWVSKNKTSSRYRRRQEFLLRGKLLGLFKPDDTMAQALATATPLSEEEEEEEEESDNSVPESPTRTGRGPLAAKGAGEDCRVNQDCRSTFCVVVVPTKDHEAKKREETTTKMASSATGQRRHCQNLVSAGDYCQKDESTTGYCVSPHRLRTDDVDESII